MGNRGTTPSWDEEEIAKYGLFAHMDFTARRLRHRYGRRGARRELITVLHKILEAKKKLESESAQS